MQRSSSLQISFDPTYEHLTIHEIKLIRDGQTIDKLDPSKVRMLDREENLESHMLDGNLTFYYPLEDVRTGDTISYSYTLKGFQPAFEGKPYMNSRLQWSYPVGHQLFRIVGNKDRKIKIQTIAGAEQPKMTHLAGDLAEWRWESTDIPAASSRIEPSGLALCISRCSPDGNGLLGGRLEVGLRIILISTARWVRASGKPSMPSPASTPRRRPASKPRSNSYRIAFAIWVLR